jgi:hypothetical protein
VSFKYQGQLSGGSENPVTLAVRIANSSTVAVGEAVQTEAFGSGGGCKRAAAGTEVLGIVVGIVNKDGIDLDNANDSSYDGTWTSSSQTYVAASDNMTDKEIKALVVVDKNSLWRNDAAGDLAVADELKYFDLTSATQIADQNGDDNAGAFILISRDPLGDGDDSQGLFKIAESELDAYAQQ